MSPEITLSKLKQEASERGWFLRHFPTWSLLPASPPREYGTLCATFGGATFFLSEAQVSRASVFSAIAVGAAPLSCLLYGVPCTEMSSVSRLFLNNTGVVVADDDARGPFIATRVCPYEHAANALCVHCYGGSSIVPGPHMFTVRGTHLGETLVMHGALSALIDNAASGEIRMPQGILHCQVGHRLRYIDDLIIDMKALGVDEYYLTGVCFEVSNLGTVHCLFSYVATMVENGPRLVASGVQGGADATESLHVSRCLRKARAHLVTTYIDYDCPRRCDLCGTESYLHVHYDLLLRQVIHATPWTDARMCLACVQEVAARYKDLTIWVDLLPTNPLALRARLDTSPLVSSTMRERILTA